MPRPWFLSAFRRRVGRKVEREEEREGRRKSESLLGSGFTEDFGTVRSG